MHLDPSVFYLPINPSDRTNVYQGWPWDVSAHIRWMISTPLEGPWISEKEGVHVMKLSWGKVVKLDVNGTQLP
jgi:hypothetical protein